MENNVTKMSFNGFRLGYTAKRILKEKTKILDGKATTPDSMNLFKKYIQKHITNSNTNQNQN